MARRRGTRKGDTTWSRKPQARRRLQEQDLEREDGRPTDGAPLGLTSLIGPTEGDAQRSQAAYLSNANLPATHRRRVASQIGRIAGNRHVQRVVAASRSREPKIQRVWDPPELQANGIQFLQEVGRISSVYNDYELRARSDENSEDLTSYGREML